MFYGNADGYKTYHTARGRTVPTSLTDSEIESALLVASEWVDSRYGGSFIGTKTNGYLQEREWPRVNAVVQSYPSYIFPDNEVPEQIVKATYEAALRQLESAGSLTVDYTPSKYKSVRVESAVSVEYATFDGAFSTQMEIPIVDTLLSSLLKADADKFAGCSGMVARV